MLRTVPRERAYQSNIGLASDIVTKIGAFGAAGAAGAGVGLPAGVSIPSSLFSDTTSIVNKDFLFGEAKISTVYGFVKAALTSHTKETLPEPDESHWTFLLAVSVVRDHQAICSANNILALLRQNAASPVVATKASGDGSASGSDRPATKDTTTKAGATATK